MDEEREILAFPMDLTEYDASEMGLWNGSYTAGVVSKENFLTVKASGNMAVTLSAGLFYLKRDTFRSIAGLSQTALQFIVPAAHTSLIRYDAIGFRYDKNLETVEKLYRQGTPSQKPQIPTISRGAVDADEIFVSYIEVPPGAIQIQQVNIHDLRANEMYCGYVRDGIERIPTQQFYDNWWNWFSRLQLDTEQKAAAFTAWMVAFWHDNEVALSAWLLDFKTTSRADFDAWFTSFKTSNNTIYYSWYNAFKSDSETNFNDWFQNLQNQLDDHQAANLQNQINHHKAKLATDAKGVHGIRYVDGKLQIDVGGLWVTVAEVVRGLRSTYIDALGMTSFEIDALQYTSTQMDNLLETED